MNMVDSPHFNKITDKIQSLQASLRALWMQPGGGQNISAEEANKIATAVLPELQSLIDETKQSIASHAKSKSQSESQ